MAARIALRGRPSSSPNPSVGAVVVADGKLVSRGWTMRGGRPHAEAVALKQALNAARGATLYVTLEPCAHQSPRGPSCASLIARSGLSRVVVAERDPDPRTAGRGMAMIEEAGIAVERLECEQARDSLAGYLARRTFNRPHVILKLAMSQDGFIATESGESRWITGEIARHHVHSRRALADAILVGGNTWRIDAPRLDVRLPGMEDRNPERIVLSRDLSIDAARTIRTPQDITSLEHVQYLYVEGGAQTAASFLRAGLVDRLEIYRAPILLGAGRPALADYGLGSLAEAHGQWQSVDRRSLGPDRYEAFIRSSEERPPCSPA